MENSKFARASRQTEAQTEGVVSFAAYFNKKAVSPMVRALQVLHAAELAVENELSAPVGSKTVKATNSKPALMTVERRNGKFAGRMLAITEDSYYLSCGNL